MSIIPCIQDAAMTFVVKEIARAINIPAHVVGGAIRDAITVFIDPNTGVITFGIRSRDIDIVVDNGSAEWCAEQIASHFGGTVAKIGHPTPRAYQVRFKIGDTEWEVEFINNTESSIWMDMWRRDFTCNAIAIPIEVFAEGMEMGQMDTRRIVDPFGGVNDIHHKVMRAVSHKAMIYDPSRIIRCGRFIATKEFWPDAKTMAIMSNPANRERIKKNCTPDSTWTQMQKIIESGNVHKVFQFFDDIGIVDIVCPGFVNKQRAMEAMRWVDICFRQDGIASDMFIIRIAAIAMGFDDPVQRMTEMRIPSKTVQVAAKIVKGFHAAYSDEQWAIHDAVGAKNVEAACWFAKTQSYARGETPPFDRFNAAINWQPPVVPVRGDEIAKACGIKGRQIGEMMKSIDYAMRRGEIPADATAETVIAFAQAIVKQARATTPER